MTAGAVGTVVDAVRGTSTARSAGAAPLAVYDAALAAAATGIAEPLRVRTVDGAVGMVGLSDWTGELSAADRTVVDRCTGPTLDVGCGPGRFTAAVAATGTAALGVDVCPTAVRLTRQRGGQALRRSVFTRLPAEGRWRHVLLTDGNIGIGADPVRLLIRCRVLLATTGTLLVELDPPGSPSGTGTLRLQHAGRASRPFRWAYLGVDDLAELADRSALRVCERWTVDGRWFAALMPAAVGEPRESRTGV